MAGSRNVEQAEMRFRQLCCLSMSGPLLAPALFRELHDILPFASCLYMWLGPEGPIDVYFNIPEVGEYLPLYADNYFRSSERKIWATTDEALTREFGPKLLDEVLRVPRAAYFGGEVYNEILKPSNVHTFIRLLIRDRGLPIGTFTISRGPHDREFTQDDQQTLARLEPFIVHALAQRRQADLTDLVDGSTAMLTVDATGSILAYSPTAKELLALAHGSLLAPPTRLPEGLHHVVRALGQVSRPQRSTPVPAWSTQNVWGAFSARAYRLEQHPGQDALLGVYLERRVPRRLAMLDTLRRLSLPARQEQVALLLSLGRTEDQAARELGLSRNTVIYHRRQIYNRLEVDSRPSLQALLSGAARPNPGVELAE